MAKNFPFFYQIERADCGATCLRMVARYYGRYYSIEHLREMTYLGKQGVSLLEIAEAAERIGFRTLGVRTNYERLREDIPLPCIAHWEGDHFVVIHHISDKYIHIADPEAGKKKLTKAEFLQGWSSASEDDSEEGVLLLLEPTPEFEAQEGDIQDQSPWMYVVRYFRRHRALLLQLALGLLAGSVIQIAVPFLLKALVDFGIGYVEPRFITIMVVSLALLMVFQVLIEAFRRWILLHIGMRVNVSILSDFLLKLTLLPLRFFDNRLTSDVLQRVHDHDRIQRFLTSTALPSMLSLFNFAVFALLLAFWHIGVFFIFLAGTSLHVLWVYYFQQRQRELDYKTFDQSRENEQKLSELIDGIQDIKLHNAEQARRWAWERTQASVSRTALKRNTYNEWQRTGADFIHEFKNLLIILFVAHAVLAKLMTLGMLVAILFVIGQLNVPTRQIIGFIQGFYEALISLERMNEIHEKDNEEQPGEKMRMLPEAGDLVAQEVSFQYGGPSSPLILHGVSLVIPKGKTTVIVGRSGSGKSTLVKLLLNIYEPVEGTVRLGDVKLQHLSNKVWRQKSAAVLQDAYIFNDTIARNIALGDEIIDERRLLKAVKAAHIQAFIEQLPRGYNTKVGKDGLGLSLGERQRLLIARALYKDPDYLFFDEATSALDTYQEMLIFDTIQDLYPNRTMIIVAHRLNVVSLAHQIVVVDSGEVVDIGTHDKLRLSNTLYSQLVRNQLELGA